MEITLKVENAHYATFLAFIKTLDYVKIEEEQPSVSHLSEPSMVYNKKNRPSVDEIEELIIAKAKRDAKAIERGELEASQFSSLEEYLADLEADLEADLNLRENDIHRIH